MESISNLFSSKYTFRISNYQREYAWGRAQIEDFWDDLNYLQPNRSHHTGTLTLEEVPDSQVQNIWGKDFVLINQLGRKPYHVVDGQQRLTTVVILLCAMLEKYKSFSGTVFVNGAYTPAQVEDNYLRWKNPATGDNHYFFDYGVNGASRDFLHKEIFRDPAFASVILTPTAYTRNLEGAKNFFDRRLKNISLPELDNLFAKLTMMMKFGVDELANTYSAYEVFETMNNRGKPLSKLEILKNRLMYLAAILDSPALQNKINGAWSEIYTQLGKNPERILNDDEFLRTHWEMFAAVNRDDSAYLLDVKFSANRLRSANFRKEHNVDELTASEISAYIESLKAAAEPWYNINFPDGALTKGESYWINRLNRLEMPRYFEALILAMVVKNVSPAKRVELLAEIENFVFVNKIAGRRSDFRESRFSSEAHLLYTDRKDISTITQEAKSEFAAHKARSVKMFVDSYASDHEFKKIVSEYILQEYEWEASQNSGATADSSMFVPGTNRKVAGLTLEHIYPQTPPISSYTKFNALTAPQKKMYRTGIGNLLLIPSALNTSLSNNGFSVKSAEYAGGSISEREVADVEGDWTPAEVENRSERILKFVNAHWKLALNAGDIAKLVP